MDAIGKTLAKYTRKTAKCWIWTSAFGGSKGQYPRMTIAGKGRYVHRVVWERAHKKKIQAGMLVRHKCDVPSCVRPSHLLLGTSKDNTQDAIARGRLACGERHGRVKLRASDVRAIRTLAQTGLSQEKIAVRYNVTQGTIWFILKGRTWRHV